jgi:hypothetical protein
VPGNFSSTLYNPTVSPLGNVTYYVSVSDGYNVSNGSVAVTVNPRPVGDAGSDKIIPHGTSTQLFGYATGGSGNYGYQWTPADKLVDPNVQSPFTNNLYSTTLFSLQVTDLTTGCEASATSEMTVTVSGDALAVNPVAQPEVICEGDTITLFALAGGGSGSYNYTWTSDPPGFTSALPSPWIIPTQTTIYQVAVNDGFNDVTGYCTVTVLDAPEVTLGPESITACVYDTITLDAGNPGSDYLWSNGSTTQTIDVATTGLGFDVQNYSVLVTSPSTCQSSASITIVFDFSVCSGIDDPDHTPLVKLYPNPGDGKMTITLNDHNQSVDLTVSDITGRTVYGPARISGNASRVDIGKLPAGLYFLHFRNEEGIADIYKYVFKY